MLLPRRRETSGRVFAERRRQIHLVLLLLAQDLADVFSDGVLLERLALLEAFAIVPDRVVLVVEIGAQHHLGLLAQHDRLGAAGRHPAQVVDVLRDRHRVLQLFAGVHLELLGDIHVRGALERLRVNHVGDDGLVFPGKILVQQIDQLLSCDHCVSHVQRSLPYRV